MKLKKNLTSWPTNSFSRALLCSMELIRRYAQVPETNFCLVLGYGNCSSHVFYWWLCFWNLLVNNRYGSISKSFRTDSITKYTLTTINTRLEATQRAMTAKLTRLTHKIAIQLNLEKSCTICSSRSRRPVRKLLDTPSYNNSLSFSYLFL
jgi:hypothetical protein